MRKLIAIFVLCCLLFLMAGYHVFFRYQLADAKEEMKKQLLSATKSEATRLVLPANEMALLAWENESEFRYKGEMYDLLKIEHQANQTVIWCLSDEKETVLLDHYLNAEKNASENSSSHTIIKILTAQYLPAPVAEVHLSVSIQKRAFPNFIFQIPKEIPTILTPPPKLC